MTNRSYDLLNDYIISCYLLVMRFLQTYWVVQFIKMLLLGYVLNLNKKLLHGNFQNLACGRSIFSITSKKWRANDFACKTLVRNYRDCPTPRKYSTKSFPNILDFTSCRDYLRAILSNNDLNIVSKDWPHLLDQIVDTISKK